MIYSKCKVDLSRYLGPGRYRGIIAILSRFHTMYGQKCAYMSTSARGNTDGNSMWTDTHGLLAQYSQFSPIPINGDEPDRLK